MGPEAPAPPLPVRRRQTTHRGGHAQPGEQPGEQSGAGAETGWKEDGVLEEKTLQLLLAPSTPQPCTPSPVGAHQGPGENCGPLSLSLMRGGEARPDAPPSVTTLLLPTEVGSPRSTEVDESLFVSLEQVLPLPPAAMSEAGLNLALCGPRARPRASPHDMALCLVSSCEFEQLVAVPMALAHVAPGSANDSSARSQELVGAPGVQETSPTSVSKCLPTLS